MLYKNLPLTGSDKRERERERELAERESRFRVLREKVLCVFGGGEQVDRSILSPPHSPETAAARAQSFGELMSSAFCILA